MNSRSESGIALPLAIIMVLLVSVVGAGLLTFVVSDLESASSTQRGQQAFGLADAGVAAAQDYLNSDEFNPDEIENDEWFCKEDETHCDGKEIVIPDAGSTQVEITATEGGYKVESKGSSTALAQRRIVASFTEGASATVPNLVYANDDVEVERFSLEGMTMYSEGTVTLDQPGAFLRSANIFSAEDVRLTSSQSLATICASALGASIRVQLLGSEPLSTSGTDPFETWSNELNPTARKVTSPGIGAEGRIGYKNLMTCKPIGWGSRYFDRQTADNGLLGTILDASLNTLLGGNRLRAKFVAPEQLSSDPLPANRKLTYPFDSDIERQIETASTDLEKVSKLQNRSIGFPGGDSSITADSGNFIEVENKVKSVSICDVSEPDCGDGDLKIVWPTVPEGTPQSEWPVVFVSFTNSGNGNNVEWNVVPNPEPSAPSGSDPRVRCDAMRLSTPDAVRRGILVVENGGVEFSDDSAALFEGAIVTGVTDSATSKHNLEVESDDLCVWGPILLDGEISGGDHTSFGPLPEPLTVRVGEETEDPDPPPLDPPPPGTNDFRVERESWRESYE